jgi:uncharacterized protein (TIGR02453 family)
LPLVGDLRRGIFRIYRDVRFSPDKRLYKTHAGAVLTRSGGRHDPGVLYIHVAPGESMVAAGFWHPDPALLARLRRAVLADPEGFLTIVERLCTAGCPLSTCAVTRRRFSSGCKAHPAIAPAGSSRGRHGGDEMSEAPG